MRKQIFQAIYSRLTERVPDIQFIGLWNGDDILNGGTLEPVPAILVEFETIDWKKQNNGAIRGDVAVRLHLITRIAGTRSLDAPKLSDTLEFFDLIQQINVAMQGLRGDNFAGFQLTTSTINYDHAEWMESIERYITSAQDLTTASKISRVQVSSLNLHP